MDSQSPEPNYSSSYGNYQSPSSLRDTEETMQLIKVLTEHEDFLNVLRRELRGEQLYQDEKGETYWVQVDKPMFVKLDKTNKPIKVVNPKTTKEEYIVNDDAVNEVISTLKASGLNPVSPLTNIDENEIRADLMELESKIAMLLATKRKEWGLDKAEYPLAVGKIKVLIKDARYRAKDGTVLKALRTITSRIEQASETRRAREIPSPYR